MSRLRELLGRFGRDDGGSMTVFTLLFLVLMLVFAGISVDMIRHEAARSRLQAVSDRAVLAAADLQQVYGSSWDAEDVVRDYFAKAGLLDQLTDVSVTETVNSRRVSATASLDMNTFFMRMAGVDSLTAPASAAAEESANDIEIVLVLDVSGSMRSSSRIQNLRAAASDFVRDMLDDDEKRISIAIVPFNAQVNLGPTLFNAMVDTGYNITNRHAIPNSFCIDTPAGAYNLAGYDFTPPLASRLALPQAAHADGQAATTTSNQYYNDPRQPVENDTNNEGNVPCVRDPRNFVRPPSQDIAELQGWIGQLNAFGNTSITRGMDIGLMLLDPSSAPLYDRLIASGNMPANLGDRPYAYDRPNTLKVIVVMTDGEHVASRFIETSGTDGRYKTGTSPIWRSGTGTAARYSILQDRANTNEDYWVPHTGQWLTAPYSGSGAAVRLTWDQVWGGDGSSALPGLRVRWVAWQLYARALGTSDSNRTSIYNTWVNNFTGDTNVANMNTTLQQSCTQAKNAGVIVYGIALSAPANGQTQIRNCASSASHYFYTTSSELGTTFNAIASHINALRLIR